MSWRPFEAPLRIEPVRSGSTLARLLAGYGLAAAALSLHHHPVLGRLALAVLPLSFLVEFLFWLTGPLPRGIRALVLRVDGSWIAEFKDGGVAELELRKIVRVSPSVIRVRLRPGIGARTLDLSFAADALAPATHRRLRVRLCWIPPTSVIVGRIHGHSST